MCLPIYNGNGDTKKVIGVAAAFDKIGSKSWVTTTTTCA